MLRGNRYRGCQAYPCRSGGVNCSDRSCVRCQCSRTCGTGEQYRSAECVDVVGRRLDDSKCRRQDRLTTQSCSRSACPYWIKGHWSAVRTLFVVYSHIDCVKYSPDFLRPIVTAEAFEATVDWLAGLRQQTWPQAGRSSLSFPTD